MSGLLNDRDIKMMQDVVSKLYTDTFDAWRFEHVESDGIWGQVSNLIYEGVPCHLSNDNDYFMDVPEDLEQIPNVRDSYTLFAGADVRLRAGDRVCVYTKGGSVEGSVGTSFVRDVGTQTRMRSRRIV